MIEIIGYSLNAYTGNIYIAWDMDGVPQQVFEPGIAKLLDLLMDAGYIADYHTDDVADVAILIDRRKHWLEFERWLSDEANEDLCKAIINQYLITHA